MTDTEIIGQFLREYLPASLSAQLAPEPPVVMEGTFVDDYLQQNHSDVLVKVRLLDGKEVWPYVLLEHKSTRMSLPGCSCWATSGTRGCAGI